MNDSSSLSPALSPDTPRPLTPDEVEAMLMKRPTVLGAIHGILTGRSDTTWPERLSVWVEGKNTRVLSEWHWAWPLPKVNWFRNRRHAMAMARRMRLHADSLRQRGEQPRLALVGHSNGACIAFETARRLIEAGESVECLILISAALPVNSTLRRVKRWISEGSLGRCVAYCSKEDRVLSLTRWLPCFLTFPYGRLGRNGWGMQNHALWPEITERWTTQGHTGWWKARSAERGEQDTFEKIWADIVEPDFLAFHQHARMGEAPKQANETSPPASQDIDPELGF